MGPSPPAAVPQRACPVVPLRCSLLCSVPGVAVKLRRSRAPQSRESPGLPGLRLSAGGSDYYPMGSSLVKPEASRPHCNAVSCAVASPLGFVAVWASGCIAGPVGASPPSLPLRAARSESRVAVRRLFQRVGVRMRGRGLSIGAPLSGRLTGARRCGLRSLAARLELCALVRPSSAVRGRVARNPRLSGGAESLFAHSGLAARGGGVARAPARARRPRPPATDASIARGSSVARIRLPG